ncbi:Eco47II family restriction endonuclease [Mucilaginibacter terrae]|uniref:Eco47II family restriction endonuclease n=1 Tax=Mucilaginibacter terrae TaxID=1955052 RepID=A0ABU3GQN5_9SPHI|nr:Eco47II family restriction endonuclease [Mucilaginibacter terrae]MDT3402094.1 hypothetical protein [Mucilaginibacter terrae]
MKNKYLNYISDEHLLKCISGLHQSYIKAKNSISSGRFYANKVDTIKLTFDSNFNEIDQDDLVDTEILRQIDKSINNSIGTFHEQILGGINGYEVGKLSGFDIKAVDNSLFADIKNKHNTMNSSAAESLYQKLAKYADTYKKAKCYWVQVLAKGSFNKNWSGNINGREYNHTRVFMISGDQFYNMLSGEDDALIQLYKALPFAIKDYLSTIEKQDKVIEHSALSEIKSRADKSQRSILDQITFENFTYYLGVDKL